MLSADIDECGPGKKFLGRRRRRKDGDLLSREEREEKEDEKLFHLQKTLYIPTPPFIVCRAFPKEFYDFFDKQKTKTAKLFKQMERKLSTRNSWCLP